MGNLQHSEATLYKQGWHTANCIYEMQAAFNASKEEETPQIELVERQLEAVEFYLDVCNAVKEGMQASRLFRLGVLDYIQSTRKAAYDRLMQCFKALQGGSECH